MAGTWYPLGSNMAYGETSVIVLPNQAATPEDVVVWNSLDPIKPEYPNRFLINLNIAVNFPLPTSQQPSEDRYPWLTLRGAAWMGRGLKAAGTNPADTCDASKLPDLYVMGSIGVADANPFEEANIFPEWPTHRKLHIGGTTFMGPAIGPSSTGASGYPRLSIEGTACIGKNLIPPQTPPTNSPYVDPQAPELYVKGRVGIGDISPISANEPHLDEMPSHRKLDVRGTARIGPVSTTFDKNTPTNPPSKKLDDGYENIWQGFEPALLVEDGCIRHQSNFRVERQEAPIIPPPPPGYPCYTLTLNPKSIGPESIATTTIGRLSALEDPKKSTNYTTSDPNVARERYCLGIKDTKRDIDYERKEKKALRKEKKRKILRNWLMEQSGLNYLDTLTRDTESVDRYGIQLKWGDSYSMFQLVPKDPLPSSSGKDTVIYWGQHKDDRFRIRFLGYRTTNDQVHGANFGGRDLVVLYPAGLMKVRGAIVSYWKNKAISDRRYKKNIEPIRHALKSVMSLRGVTYEWDQSAFTDTEVEPGQQLGFIAQDIEAILPQVVDTDEEGMKSVDYSRLTSVLVEAVKEQQELIRLQDERIRKLEALLSEGSLPKQT